MEIAKDDLGACQVCGVPIDRGEWIDTSKTLGAKHASHASWRVESAIETEPIPSSGFLFNTSEVAMIEHAKEVLNVKRVAFDGPTAMQVDTSRLSLQLVRVFELMKSGQYQTLRQIADATGCLETSASARLRDMRKPRFGHEVVSRKVAGVTPPVYEYRLIVNKQKMSDEDRNDERQSAA